MKPYLTVLKAGRAEQDIERSRFIGYAIPAKTVSECEEFFNHIRKENRLATHNVPAYVLGECGQLQWAGDDGEPRGTSGAPIVNMLDKRGISDVAVMITRYFGGTKLGTGGLVRAYTSTAKLAVEAAGIGLVSEKLVLFLEMDYSGYNRLESSADSSYSIEGAMFTDVVTVSLVIPPDEREAALIEVRNLCPTARVVTERMDRVTTPFPLDVVNLWENQKAIK